MKDQDRTEDVEFSLEASLNEKSKNSIPSADATIRAAAALSSTSQPDTNDEKRKIAQQLEFDYIQMVKAREQFEESKKQRWFVCLGSEPMSEDSVHGS